MSVPNPPANIQSIFDAAPAEVRDGLIALRKLILETAAQLPEVGEVTECLKWGQPAFTTPATKSGSTLRIGCPKSGGFALYAHCQTNIISSYAANFPGMDRIEGNRAVVFSDVDEIDSARLSHLIAHALRYHL